MTIWLPLIVFAGIVLSVLVVTAEALKKLFTSMPGRDDDSAETHR